MPINDSSPEWWREKWWLQDQYASAYRDRRNAEEVDRAISRLAEVFDGEWERKTPRHQMHYWLACTGLLPLQFLFGFGNDLLAVEGSRRLPSLIEDLRRASEFESARFELEIAAHLKRCGHDIEFRSRVPNGKESDFVARFEVQQVFFEIKRLRESQTQLALNALVQSISFSVSDLTRHSSHPAIKDRGYKVDLDPSLVNLLGSGPGSDMNVIEGITNEILGAITKRAEHDQPLDFVISSIARIFVGDAERQESSVTCPMVTSQAELRRLVGGRLQSAIEQLHPEHAGLIVVQTPGGLELEVTEVVLRGLLASLGARASHLSAVVFFPVYYSMPTVWSLFRPFAVTNRGARFPLDGLRAFEDLKRLLQVA